MNDSALQIGRHLLEKADNLARSGEEIRVAVQGVGLINVKSVQFDENTPEIATINCWLRKGKDSISWIAPCRLILGVQIRERRSLPTE